MIHLNTLFVTAEGAWLHKEHETIVVRVDGEMKAQIPIVQLRGVVCFGRVSASPPLLAALSDAGIHVAYFSDTGRFYARVEGVPGGNVLLRRQQYRAADDAAGSLEIARSIVIGKIANTRQFLLHARRDAPQERRERLDAGCHRLMLHLEALPRAATIDEVRGLEGIAAKDYFSVFEALLKQGEEDFRFEGRSRRPPRDRVNALLSFGYALLMQDCAGAAAGVGLDPAVGFLHEERPGRLSLALDLMEELRAPVVDRLVVALVNRRQIAGSDLREDPGGEWRLTDAGRKTFLVGYQDAKKAECQHHFLEQGVNWGRVPHLQALLMARTIRGDLKRYPPFSIR